MIEKSGSSKSSSVHQCFVKSAPAMMSLSTLFATIVMFSSLVHSTGAELLTLQEFRKTKNITVYRVTPVNLTGIADRNTGDDGGDVFFTLYVDTLSDGAPV